MPEAIKTRDQIAFSRHFQQQAKTKGFTAAQIMTALKFPKKITPVTRYPGQWRYCGGGVAVVVAFDRAVPECITVYLDGVVTPLRDDQKNDRAAMSSRRLTSVR